MPRLLEEAEPQRRMGDLKMVKGMHKIVYIMLLLAALIGCVSAEAGPAR